MRDAIIRTALLLVVAGVCWRFVWPQAPRNPARSTVSELKLQIVPDKATYSLNDRISTKLEFMNIAGRTLCFPRPSQEAEEPEQGYVITKAVAPPETPDKDRFLDHYDGGIAWPREKLVQEIRERWIWLAPGAEYSTGSVQIRMKLSAPGQWRLEATYHPPEGSFGKPAEFRKYIDSASHIAGCTVPQGVVSAEPISFNVTP